MVVALITSAHYSVRSTLPHCVSFRAGEFGLTQDCVAQAETLTYLAITDLDRDSGVLGFLDDSKYRELIRAIGNMMGSDCEPG